MWAALFTVYLPVQSRLGLLDVLMPLHPHAEKPLMAQRTPPPISQQTKGLLWALWRSISSIPRDAGTHLVSRGTLLLSTQLSWSCTDSGVVARSLGAGAGAWIWFRRLVREFLLRELAEEWWWDREWLWGGGRGGLSVDWLWWFEGPKTEKKNKSQMCVWSHCSPRRFQGATAWEKRLCLSDLWASKRGQIRSVIIWDQQQKTVLPACTAGMLTKTVFKF